MKPLMNRLVFRTAGVLFLGMLTIGALLITIGWYWICKPMVHHSTMNMALQLQNAAETYLSLPEPERAAFQQRLHQSHRLKVALAEGAPVGQPSRLPYLLHLNQALSKLTGQPVVLLQNGGHYIVDFPSQPVPLRFQFDHDNIGTDLQTAIVSMLLLLLLASLPTALFLAKCMTRRIELMANQTETCGIDTMPLPEDGPDELRDIARHFNHIAAQNRELLDNRATMLAGISHDLRAPITRARMALELAREDMNNDLALRIERALLQMEALITQYLDFSADSAKEVATPQNVATLLKEITQTFRQATIRLDVPDLEISLPVRAFSRCAQNLLDNAVHHGAEPVSVHFHQSDSTWVLEITDQGAGIPDKQLNQVFKPFQRLNNARTQPGSGLGLSIVQEICRAQGWFVTLMPRPGGGLIARLSMPLAAQGPEQD